MNIRPQSPSGIHFPDHLRRLLPEQQGFRAPEQEFNNAEQRKSRSRCLLGFILHAISVLIVILAVLLIVQWIVHQTQDHPHQKKTLNLASLKCILSMHWHFLKGMQGIKNSLPTTGVDLVQYMYNYRSNNFGRNLDWIYEKLREMLNNWKRQPDDEISEHSNTVLNLFGVVKIRRRNAAPIRACRSIHVKKSRKPEKMNKQMPPTKHQVSKKTDICSLLGVCKMIIRSLNMVFDLFSF